MKNSQIKTLILITANLIFGSISPAIFAEDSLYEIQYLLVDTNFEGASYEPGALMYKYIIPYNRILNLEGIVGLGVTEEKSTRKIGIAGTYRQKLKVANILGIQLGLYGELEPKVHAYAHIGLTRLEYDISTPDWAGGLDGAQSDTGLSYGVGLNFKLLNRGAFVVEFNEFPDITSSNITISTSTLSIGYQMPFM